MGGLVCAPLWVSIGALPFLDRSPAREQQASHHDGGLLLPVRPFAPAGIAVFLIVGVFFVALALVALYAAVADQMYSFIIGFLLLGGVGAIFLTTAVMSVRQLRAGAGGIVADPEGIRLTSLSRDVWSVPWDQVTGIRAHWLRMAIGLKMPTDSIANYLQIQAPEWTAPGRLGRLGRTGGPNLEVRSLAMDPYAALRVLTYYVEHPDARHELATDAAVARARLSTSYDN
ncbi:MAG: hypothetical protein V9G04_12340 [Nocardioides sp.]